MEIALNLLLFLPKLALKLILFVLGSILKIFLFAVQIIADIFSITFAIIGTLTSLGALFMFIVTLRGGASAFGSTGQFIGQAVLFFSMICFGGLIAALPEIIWELDVIPAFFLELGCGVPLWD